MKLNFGLIVFLSISAFGQESTEERKSYCINPTEIPTVAKQVVKKITSTLGGDPLQKTSFRTFLCDHNKVNIVCDLNKCSIFFSRQIFSKLNENELYAVVAHEIGHLLDYNYSIEGEMEADQFAIASMVMNGVPVEYYSSMLKKVNTVNKVYFLNKRILIIDKFLKENKPPEMKFVRRITGFR